MDSLLQKEKERERERELLQREAEIEQREKLFDGKIKSYLETLKGEIIQEMRQLIQSSGQSNDEQAKALLPVPKIKVKVLAAQPTLKMESAHPSDEQLSSQGSTDNDLFKTPIKGDQQPMEESKPVRSAKKEAQKRLNENLEDMKTYEQEKKKWKKENSV